MTPSAIPSLRLRSVRTARSTTNAPSQRVTISSLACTRERTPWPWAAWMGSPIRPPVALSWLSVADNISMRPHLYAYPPRAARVAALIKKELGADVETTGADPGEFTVWVGDKIVARKSWLRFPADQRVLEAVRAALDS